ncbi:alginate O-acetyltransferase AlgX-related protein [Cognatilysobacter lacus]|uniref:AlgX/AlgJ SGNH hydrolase-like domain-containing protein n=1 Tax=Cognatilysobacter lacus TaxID=1643323 RepID=A0A5D8Z8I8_9GAMM|nr:hypothetical protein [Lysobacter lacus]TZF91228.1 hypothetical protein FW784_02475 [Lysobacter lacus]
MSRARSTFLVGGAAAVILGMLFIPYGPGLPAPELRENRELAPLPQWVPTRAGLGAYRKGMDAYVADNFPARPYLIEAVNYVRYRLGYSGSRTVVVGRRGWLFFDDGTHLDHLRPSRLELAQAEAWVEKLRARSAFVHAGGAHFLVFVPPVKERVYPELAPRWAAAPGVSDAELLANLAAARQAGDVLLPLPALRAARASQPYIYSPYDTHWSGYGAHVGYMQLMRSLARSGLSDAALPLAAFRQRAVDDSTATTPQDMALMLGISGLIDQHYPQVEPIAPVPKPVERFLTDRQDGYGDRVLYTGNVGEPVLLLSGDSFSWQLAPFLYPHFSKIVLSHTIRGFFRLDLIQRHKPNFVVLEVLERQVRNAMADPVIGAFRDTTRVDVAAAAADSAGGRAACSVDSLSRDVLDKGPATIRASGWAADVADGQLPGALGLVLQSPTHSYAMTFPGGLDRADVAQAFHRPAVRYSGFDVTAPISPLAPGRYNIYVLEQFSRPQPRLCATGKTFDVP